MAVQTIVVYDTQANGSKKMKVGDKERFFPSWSPTSNNRKWKWKSSNPKVATVTSSGTVIARQKGTTTLTVTLSSNEKVTASKKLTVLPIDLRAESDNLTLSYRYPIYTGKPVKPTLNLAINQGKNNEVKFVQGKDFKVVYSKNVNAGNGVGAATITALPTSILCTGSVEASFTIKPAPLDKAAVKGVANRKYTGKTVAGQNVKVTLEGKTLKKGADYKLQYLNASKKAISASNVKAKGTYYVVVVGTGNYKGSISKPFKVV